MRETVFELDSVTVDARANFERQLGEHGGPDVEVADWAQRYAEAPPIFHIDTLDGMTQWAGPDGALTLKSYRSLNAFSQNLTAPENNFGRMCEEDVKRGLDRFVFASLGKLVQNGDRSFATVVLKPESLSEGFVSFHDLVDFGSLLVGPGERFGDHDEAAVTTNNQEAFEAFAASLTPGEDFSELFARYLSSNFASLKEFLTSYDFIPGEKDIPHPWSIAGHEMQARGNLMVEHGHQRPFEETEGYAYRGPQMIVRNKIGREHVAGVILYDGGDDESAQKLKRLQSILKVKNVTTEVATQADLSPYGEAIPHELFERGDDRFMTVAVMSALFNMAYSGIALEMQRAQS